MEKRINITKQLLLKALTECAVILYHKITTTKLKGFELINPDYCIDLLDILKFETLFFF